VADDLTLAEALSGNSADPCVGRFLEFRIVRNPATPDVSQVPAVMIPNPDLSKIPVARQRTFEFGRGANQNTNDPVSSFFGPWGVKTDGGDMLAADFGRISAAPRFGTREIWTLRNGGGGWDHRSTSTSRRADPRPRRQSQQRPGGGTRPQGRLPAAPGGSDHDHDAVPGLGRHVHGALPQHGARGQRHAAALGDRR
jgi:hypothetical protein